MVSVTLLVGQSGSTAYVDATAFQVKKGNGVFGGGDDVTAIDLVRPSVSRVFTLPNTATVLAVTARGALHRGAFERSADVLIGSL